ncbi:MAG TPA: hypothetical protein VFT43_03965, partial [Candidatus Polarisedimenticolia bacterium]|nr:hypothetical protein [Candidatus Polarisedimenticolia bacterium]
LPSAREGGVKRPIGFAASLFAIVLLLAAPPAPAGATESAAAPATTRVTYLTGTSVYVEAGREEGLREGDEAQVVRDGQTIATLRVVFLSAHRASCSVVRGTGTVVIGDLVRFVPHGPAEAPRSGIFETPAQPGSPPGGPAIGDTSRGASSPGGLWGTGLRGRVGLRYLQVKDREVASAGFSQPALDLRLDGYGLDGGPLDLAVDVRARRTSRTLASGADSNDSQSRVYRLAVSYHLDDRQAITVGRQFAPAVAALSIFDGVLYDLEGSRWGAGLFTGAQPDAVDLGLSGDIREHGGFVQFRSAPGGAQRWNLTTGIIGSYTQGTVNREFFYLQGQYSNNRLSSFLTQEVDVNRGWKTSEAGESSISPTSTFASLHLRASDRLTFHAGYDNRRNVRLVRDRVTPATAFDDSHRQGGWAGASLRFGGHLETDVDLRTSGGGPSGIASGYSVGLGVDRIGDHNLAVWGRSTRYDNDRSEGWLDSVSAGLDLGPRARLELSLGTLEETNLTDSSLDRSTTWTGLDLDLLLARRWFLLLSTETNRGDQESNDQAYASLTYRF